MASIELRLLMRAWRNGRRAGLRIRFRKEWRFKSSRAHQLLAVFTGRLAAENLEALLSSIKPQRPFRLHWSQQVRVDGF